MHIIPKLSMRIYSLNIKSASYYTFVFFLVYLLSYSYGRNQVFKTYGLVYAFVLFLITFVCYLYFKGFKIRYYHNGIIIFIFFNLLVILNSTLKGMLKSGLLVGGIQIIILFSILFLIQILQYKKEIYLHTTFKFILFLGFISFLFGMYVYTFGSLSLGPLSIKYSVYGTEGHRMAAWFGSPNTLASIFSIQILILIYYFNNNKINGAILRRLMYIIILFTAIVGLILTGSRGSLLALIVGIINYMIINSKPLKRKRIVFKSTIKKRKFTRIFYVALFILLLTFLMILFGIDANFLIDKLIRPENIEAQLDMETFDRTVILAISIHIIANASLMNLLLGHGPQYFFNLTGHSSHSSHFSTIINYGIIAYLILIGFLIYTYFFTIKNNKINNIHSITSSIIIYLAIKGFFNHAFPGYGVEGIIGMMTILVIYLKD